MGSEPAPPEGASSKPSAHAGSVWRARAGADPRPTAALTRKVVAGHVQQLKLKFDENGSQVQFSIHWPHCRCLRPHGGGLVNAQNTATCINCYGDLQHATRLLHFLKISLFLEGKGRRKRGRETSTRGCLLHAPPLKT